MSDKKILDATCGSRTIWFNKEHPAAVYCDIRKEELTGIWKSGDGQSERTCYIDPDIQCDFTDLPFPDESFFLVVFDPPHLRYAGKTGWLAKKYGRLDEHWPEMLHDGFQECMRVLKEDGVLIFKWAETDIPAQKVWKAIGQKPLFGHHSGKRSGTFWGCYMNSCVSAKKGCWITLSEWKYSKEKGRFVPVCVKTEYVDGEKIKEDTMYSLKDGEFVEVCEHNE